MIKENILVINLPKDEFFSWDNLETFAKFQSKKPNWSVANFRRSITYQRDLPYR